MGGTMTTVRVRTLTTDRGGHPRNLYPFKEHVSRITIGNPTKQLAALFKNLS